MLILQENWSPEIPAPQFRVIIAGKRAIFRGNVEENGGTREGEEMEDMARSMAAMQKVLKKLVPEAVFP